MHRSLVVGISIVVVSAAGSRADAQSIDVAAARAEFEAGVRAASAGQWSESVIAFERSYRLNPAPPVLLNLAAAQAHSGRLVDAASTYRRFLALPPAADTTQYRADATSALEQVEHRIPSIRIDTRGLDSATRFVLDAHPIDVDALQRGIRVDPGAHVVELHDGSHTETRRVELAESQRTEIRFSRTVVAHSSESPVDHHPSVVASPWFWTVTGIVVVGAATVGVCAAAGCFDPAGPDGSAGRARWP